MSASERQVSVCGINPDNGVKVGEKMFSLRIMTAGDTIAPQWCGKKCGYKI